MKKHVSETNAESKKTGAPHTGKRTRWTTSPAKIEILTDRPDGEIGFRIPISIRDLDTANIGHGDLTERLRLVWSGNITALYPCFQGSYFIQEWNEEEARDFPNEADHWLYVALENTRTDAQRSDPIASAEAYGRIQAKLDLLWRSKTSVASRMTVQEMIRQYINNVNATSVLGSMPY